MTNLTLSFFGPPEQKHVVKVTPMQTLKDVLHSASTKFKPALVAEQCDLQVNKKAVDLNTPFRLLNIPAGFKLEIIKRSSSSAPAAVAPAPAPAAAASASHNTVAQPAASNPAAETSGSPAAAAAAQAGAPPAGTTLGANVNNVNIASHQPALGKADQPRQAASSQDPAAATLTAQSSSSSLAVAAALPGESAPSPAAAAAADVSSRPAAAAPVQTSSPPAAAAAVVVPPELAALGIQRPIYVFHQRALEAAAEAAAHSSSSAMDVDPPDEFYDLTADDLARMQQQANAKKQQGAVFRTRAARDAEEARAAAALGPVRVRLHWPDGTLLQSEFKATEPLSAVQDLVRKCSATQYAQALYLYTTPPKTVLKDPTATLYGLKLVPAAHIYIGIDDKKVALGAAGGATALAGGGDARPDTGGFIGVNTSSIYLRPEVQALMQDHVPEQIQQQQNEVEANGDGALAVADAQRAMRVAAAASRAEARGGDAAGGNKVPKWLKVGKK